MHADLVQAELGGVAVRRWRSVLVVAACAGGILAAAAPALAQEDDPDVVSGSETVDTLPEEVEVGGVTLESGTPVDVAGAFEDPGDPGVLPFTGGDLLALIALGAVAAAVGGLLLSRHRARARAPSA